MMSDTLFGFSDNATLILPYIFEIRFRRFYKQFRSVGAISINNEESERLSEKFMDFYKAIGKTWPKLSEDEHYQKALVMLNTKLSLEKREISKQKSAV